MPGQGRAPHEEVFSAGFAKVTEGTSSMCGREVRREGDGLARRTQRCGLFVEVRGEVHAGE